MKLGDFFGLQHKDYPTIQHEQSTISLSEPLLCKASHDTSPSQHHWDCKPKGWGTNLGTLAQEFDDYVHPGDCRCSHSQSTKAVSPASQRIFFISPLREHWSLGSASQHKKSLANKKSSANDQQATRNASTWHQPIEIATSLLFTSFHLCQQFCQPSKCTPWSSGSWTTKLLHGPSKEWKHGRIPVKSTKACFVITMQLFNAGVESLI